MGSHTLTCRHGTRMAEDDAFYLEHGWTRAPVLVQWMATLRCPNSCAHCLAACDGAAPADMPVLDALRLVDQAAEMGTREFLLTGGEPLVRDDLEPIARRVADRGMQLSINTAAMPDARQRRFFERVPPQFVAVSLDGPEHVHDSFRGRAGAYRDALSAIRFFSQLPGCNVVAGTSVTGINYRALRETLHIVRQSGASSWGIHLLVPEGRAKTDRGLFLSRRQLAGLLRFVKRARTYMDVSIADELGYCGDQGPLLRDVPFVCGAGRTHCVVLPGGEVVPCTTTDVTTSAGNIHDRPFADIWRDGFVRLRKKSQRGRCVSCDYWSACEGGCWLQSRRGTGCHKDVWELPSALKTAIGVAVSLGALAGAAGAQEAQVPIGMPPLVPAPSRTGNAVAALDRSVRGDFEALIPAWYGRSLKMLRRGRRERLDPEDLDTHFPPPMRDDPGVRFYEAFIHDKLADSLIGRCEAVEEALRTRHRSMALAALMWRSIVEYQLDNESDICERTKDEGAVLRGTLLALKTKAESWRRSHLRRGMPAFLARLTSRRRFGSFMSKAGPPRRPASYRLISDTARERWPGLSDVGVAEYADAHAYAEHLRLPVHFPERRSVQRLVDGVWQSEALDGHIGIFDSIRTAPGHEPPTLIVREPYGHALAVILPIEVELTYADVLRLAYEQNTPALDRFASWLGLRSMAPESPGHCAYLPAIRAIAHARDDDDARLQGKIDRARWWVADFWLY